MFDLFAFQIALARVWVRSFAGFSAFGPAGFGESPAEQKAAADAAQELEHIVRAHAAARREGAAND